MNFPDILLRHRWLLMASGLVLGAIAYPIADRLTLDRSLSSMFAPDDPVLTDYQDLQRRFGGNVVAMLVYQDDQLLSAAGLARNAEVTDRIAAVPGVRGVLSPATLNETIGLIRPAALWGLLGAGPSPDVPPLIRDDEVAAGFLELFAGYTHAADGRVAAVVAMLEPDHPPGTVAGLKQIAADLPRPIGDGVVVGEPVLIADGFDLIERDGAKLTGWTVTLLSLVILVGLRSIRYAILAILCLAWSSVVTSAVMVVLGVELSIVSTILTAIITVIVVASVLHVGVRRTHPTAGVWLLVLIPVFWTCATDAFGFLSLLVSRIRPVRQFGGMTAVAAAVSFVSLVCFVPLWVHLDVRRRKLRQRADASPDSSSDPSPTAIALRQVVAASIDRSGAIAAVVLVIAAGSIWATLRATTETSFLKNFRAGSSIVRAYDRVESRLGGAGVWDIVLPAPAVIDEAYLASVRDLQQRLRQIRVDGVGLSKVISMADAERVAAKVGLLQAAPPETRLAAMRAAMPVFAAALLTDAAIQPDAAGPGRGLRIMLRSSERLSTETKNRLIARVDSLVRRHTASPEFIASIAPAATRHGGTAEPQRSPVARGATTTGYYVMLAALVGRLVSDQWTSFAWSFVLVLGLLLLMTRDLAVALAAVVLNALPALIVLAGITLGGGRLNLGAAMIAAVSLGLSIDGSVHFLHGHRQRRDRGMTPRDAATAAGGDVGVPMLLATLALVIGFSVLAGSEFLPTATFGILVAVTMVLGVIINLTALPAAVVWIQSRRAVAER